MSASTGLHFFGGLALALFNFGSIPMAVITDKGHIYKGALTVAIPASFQFSDGHMTCSGEFPSYVSGSGKDYATPFVCGRGSKGIVIFKDLFDVRNSGGIIRFSDGTAGTFITGDGAATF